MSRTFDTEINSGDEEKQHHILMNLHQHFQMAKLRNPLKLAWGTEEFLQGATIGLFEKVVNVAIHHSDHSTSEEAKHILKQFTGNSESRQFPVVLLS